MIKSITFSLLISISIAFEFKTLTTEEVQREMDLYYKDSYPWKNFSAGFAVTPVKNQGPHGYCGTFCRVASAEGQYVIKKGYSQRNFSVEALVDCVGWSEPQIPFFLGQDNWVGQMSQEDYPFNLTAYPDTNPPIPGNPCKYAAAKVIPDSTFSNTIHYHGDEDQIAAFVFKNGPVSGGINHKVFGEQNDDHFVTKEGCEKHIGEVITHCITIIGYGKDENYGDYWLIKNSWGDNWADHGFIRVQRGIKCGSMGGMGEFTVGDPVKYFEEEDVEFLQF